MKTDITYLKEETREMVRLLNSELERLQEQAARNDAALKMLDQVDELLEENEQLMGEVKEQQAEIDRLHQQLDDKDWRVKELEAQLKEKDALLKEKDTQLNEMSKFSVNMAKKSPQEGLEKAFRIYINTSKRKTQAKREVAKTQMLDFITTAKLAMPDDIMESLNQLDDEVVVPAQVNNTVTVQAGGINVQQANKVEK